MQPSPSSFWSRVSTPNATLQRLLRSPGRRPAIVYAPTRKKAELLASRLDRSYRAAAYHAGGGDLVRYEVRYGDGAVAEIPVRGGININDWVSPAMATFPSLRTAITVVLRIFIIPFL